MLYGIQWPPTHHVRVDYKGHGRTGGARAQRAILRQRAAWTSSVQPL